MAERQEAWAPKEEQHLRRAYYRFGTEWIAKAACAGYDIGWWYAEIGTEEDEAAKNICFSCPVQKICYEFSIVAREPHGTWGGMDYKERRRVFTHLPQVERQGRPARIPEHIRLEIISRYDNGNGGVTQEALAKEYDIPQGSISRILKEHRDDPGVRWVSKEEILGRPRESG